MTIKMIALDLDGTLLRSDKTIDPLTLRRLKRKEEGIIIAIASGRDKNGTKFVYEHGTGKRQPLSSAGEWTDDLQLC